MISTKPPSSKAAPSTVTTVIDARRPSWGSQLAAVWSFRDLILLFSRRDISVRYRQTGLGALWVVLQPLLGAVLFVFVFERIAHLEVEGFDYFTFALCGLAAWTFFSSLTIRSSMSLLNNASLLSKASFPRLALPVSALPAVLLDLAVSLVVVVAACLLRGQGFGWHVLWLPLALAPLALLALGLGLLSSAFSVRYRDIQQVIPLALQLALYVSPVAYPASAVPPGLSDLYRANPVVGGIEWFRYALLGGPSPSSGALLYTWVAALLVAAVGVAVFVRREDSFADVA